MSEKIENVDNVIGDNEFVIPATPVLTDENIGDLEKYNQERVKEMGPLQKFGLKMATAAFMTISALTATQSVEAQTAIPQNGRVQTHWAQGEQNRYSPNTRTELNRYAQNVNSILSTTKNISYQDAMRQVNDYTAVYQQSISQNRDIPHEHKNKLFKYTEDAYRIAAGQLVVNNCVQHSHGGPVMATPKSGKISAQWLQGTQNNFSVNARTGLNKYTQDMNRILSNRNIPYEAAVNQARECTQRYQQSVSQNRDITRHQANDLIGYSRDALQIAECQLGVNHGVHQIPNGRGVYNGGFQVGGEFQIGGVKVNVGVGVGPDGRVQGGVHVGGRGR